MFGRAAWLCADFENERVRELRIITVPKRAHRLTVNHDSWTRGQGRCPSDLRSPNSACDAPDRCRLATTSVPFLLDRRNAGSCCRPSRPGTDRWATTELSVLAGPGKALCKRSESVARRCLLLPRGTAIAWPPPPLQVTRYWNQTPDRGARRFLASGCFVLGTSWTGRESRLAQRRDGHDRSTT